MNFTSGTYTNTGVINNYNTITVNGGTLSNTTGTIQNNIGKTINVTSGTLANGTTGVFTNDGTVSVTGTGALTNTNATANKFVNGDNGTITFNSTGANSNSGYMENKGAFEVKSGNLTNTGTINNDKTITVSGGTLTNNANGMIENNDTINVTSGELANAAGTLNNNAGHKINVSGGTFSNGTSGVFTNANTADLNVSGTGIFTNANTSTTGFVNKGTITMTSKGTSTNSGYIENGTTGIVNVNDGELQSTGTINNDNTIKVGGGILNNTTGAIYNNKDKNINVTSGSLKNGKTFNDDGTVTLSTTGVLDNSGAFTISATGKLTNNSTTAEYGVTNTGTITNSGTVDGSGTMDNAVKGVFTNSNAYTMTGKVTNAGTVNFTTTPATIQEFENSGALNVDKTTLTVASGKTLTNKASTGTIHILKDSELDVTGTLDNFGTITNDGTLVTTATNGTITNEAKSTLTNNGTFHNNGVFTVNPNSTFTGNGVFDGTGTYNATGKYVITSDMTINKPYTNNADLEIADNVTVTVTADGSLENANKITIDADADGNGTPGKLLIQGTLTNDVNKTITNNGSLENDKTFNNAGTFTNTSSYTDTADGTLTNTGKVDNQVNGTMTILGKVDNQKGAQLSNAGTITNKNAITNEGTFTNNGTYNDILGATLTNSATLDNAKDATMTILGGLTNDANGTLTNSGTLTNQNTFTNAGIFNNIGTYSDAANATTTNKGSIDNKATGLMSIFGTLDTQNGTYNNDGNIEFNPNATLIDKKRTDGQAFSVTGNGIMTLNAGSFAQLGTELFIGNTADYDIQSAGVFTVQNKEIGTTAGKLSGKQQFITSDENAVTINKAVTIPVGVVYDFRNADTVTANADVTVNGTFMDKTGTMPSIQGTGKFVYNVGSYGYLGDLLFIDKTGAVLDLEKGTIEVTEKTITLPTGDEVTITQNWKNPASETFTIAKGATLSIFAGNTFQNAGTLLVNGTMNVGDKGFYEIVQENVDGTITAGSETVNGSINVKSGGTYTDSRDNATWAGTGTINYYDGSEGFLKTTKYIGKKNDAAALMQLASGIIELKAPGTEVGDKAYSAGVMTLKANSEAFSNGFTLAANQLATVEPGAKLSIADGAKLNIDGDLVIDAADATNPMGQVIVPNGTTYTIENAGTEQIDGKITVENGGKFYDTRTAPVIKAGSLGYIEYMAGSEGYLGTTKYIGKDNTAKIALTSGSIKLDVLNADAYKNGEMTLVAGSKATSNDFESSEGQLMTIQKGATLDIFNDKSFTNNGDLVIDGTDGTLDVTAFGTYVNNGNQKVNGIIHVENNGKLVDNTDPYTVNGAVNTDVKGGTTPAAGKIIYELGGMGYHGDLPYIGPTANTYPLQLTYGKIEQVYEEGFEGDHYTLTDGSKASANDYTLSGAQTPDDAAARHLTIAKNAELTVTKAKAITIDGTLTIDKEGKLIVPSTAIYNINEGGVEDINGEIILQRAQNGVVGGTFNDNRTTPYMAGEGSIVYYSGAQGKVSGHLFIGGPKDTGADVQITDSDGALILHSGDVANTTIYEVASGSEVTSNSLALLNGERITLHNAAMVTIPSGKSLTLGGENPSEQVIFEPQPNNYVTTINLQGELIMNVNGNPLSFTSEKPEYELLLKSLPTVNGASVTMPEARISNSSDSIIWSVNATKDYAPGTIANITSGDEFVVAFLSSTAINTSSDVKVSVKDGSYANLVYGNFNEVDYIVSVPSSEKNAPTNSGLKNVVVKMTGANAADFWIEGSTNNVLTLDTINFDSSRNFTVITKKNGADYLDADTYHATIVITGTDVLGRSITDSIQLKQVVLKNTPTLSALSASALTYGQTLSESTVTGTATPATNTAALAAPVAGTYAFTDATLIPDVATEEYEVTFTPTDAKNYNIATGFTSVSVTPVDMSKVTLAPITDQPYTSNFVTPTLSLTYKGMPLVEYEDYQVVYGNNVELSTTNSPATVSIIGMGNYKGTLKSTFKIVNSDLLYFVSIPQVSGITSNPVAGTYYEYKGETFTFSLTLGKTYSKSAPVVKDTEGNVYKADANGIYSIKIDHSVILSIDGVTSNTTGIESLNGMKIWAVGHVLHIYTTKASPVLVVSMNGRMIVSDKLTVGDNSFNIDVEGTYIVKLGSQVVKIYVR